MSRRSAALVLALAPIVGSADSYSEFFRAIDVDNAVAVASLLQRGFDPNGADPRGQLPLFLALRAGSDSVARVLVEFPGTSIDRVNALGESALMMAALRGQVEWVRKLLAKGASVNKAGWAPLHYAASGPTPSVITVLLTAGAVVDARAPNGATALMTAAQHGSEESVELLLAAGADPQLVDAKGRSAAELARSVGRERLGERLGRLKP